jgi:hypothetical protein
MGRVHLVVIFGPPAVGKMTVGHALSQRTGFKLFHNHMTVEPVLDIFPFGSPPFHRLVGEFRRRVIEEACDAELPGLVFTFVWGLELEDDTETIESYVDRVEGRGGRVSFVELVADQETRLSRDSTEFRLQHKRSKRDTALSRRIVLELDAGYVMNTGAIPTVAERVFVGRDYVRVDNTHLSAAEAAERVVAAFGIESL